jgi:hypothetical protein
MANKGKWYDLTRLHSIFGGEAKTNGTSVGSGSTSDFLPLIVDRDGRPLLSSRKTIRGRTAFSIVDFGEVTYALHGKDLQYWRNGDFLTAISFRSLSEVDCECARAALVLHKLAEWLDDLHDSVGPRGLMEIVDFLQDIEALATLHAILHIREETGTCARIRLGVGLEGGDDHTCPAP